MDKLEFEESSAYQSLADCQRPLLRSAHEGKLSVDAAVDIDRACQRAMDMARKLAAADASLPRWKQAKKLKEDDRMNLSDATNYDLLCTTLDDVFTSREVKLAADALDIGEDCVLHLGASRRIGDWLNENRDRILADRATRSFR
jgi:hypothetical protein